LSFWRQVSSFGHFQQEREILAFENTSELISKCILFLIFAYFLSQTKAQTVRLNPSLICMNDMQGNGLSKEWIAITFDNEMNKSATKNVLCKQIENGHQFQ